MRRRCRAMGKKLSKNDIVSLKRRIKNAKTNTEDAHYLLKLAAFYSKKGEMPKDLGEYLAACLTEFLGNPEKAKYAFNLIEQRVGRKTNNFPNYTIALEMERLRSEEKMTLGKAAEKIQRNQSLSISPRQITNIYRKYRDDDAYRAWKAALRDLEE